MLITTGRSKVETYKVKAYRRQRQFVYGFCQLSHVAPGHALIVSVCILMLPMVRLPAEHVELAITYHQNPINQWYVHRYYITLNQAPLVLPSLISIVLPAMVLQNCIVKLNISFPSYIASYFSARHIPLNLQLDGEVMLDLLLLLSGDIETNPGPVGQFFCVCVCVCNLA